METYKFIGNLEDGIRETTRENRFVNEMLELLFRLVGMRLPYTEYRTLFSYWHEGVAMKAFLFVDLTFFCPITFIVGILQAPELVNGGAGVIGDKPVLNKIKN